MMLKWFPVLMLLTAPEAASAQESASQPVTVRADARDTLQLPEGFDGAPPPQLPSTVSRDTSGRVTVRAIALTAPLRLDGNLDEEIYQTITPISDFVQNEPQIGAPGTERTEVWISFDSDNIYVSVRATESQPQRMVVNEMRRDSLAIVQNENFQFALDTFYDRRNSVSFQFNPLGGRMDGQIANEDQFNRDWNPVWSLEVRRHADGWTAEAAVPFKSIRFNPGTAQIWGFQARRINRWKNEISYVTPLPAGTGDNGHTRVSQYATLVGLQVPAGSRVLDLKPYVISDVTTDRNPSRLRDNDLSGDFGFDAKYTLTKSLTGDFTYNTDFAQVEADEQQVNLTRFSLFFPEKREFFLENAGIFQFGGASNNNNSETPIMFYSRRIGLERGLAVPIDAGGRVSGRQGAFTLGLINIQSGDQDDLGVPSTNFTAARLRRDVLRRSSIGAIYTRRSIATNGSGDAQLYAAEREQALVLEEELALLGKEQAEPGEVHLLLVGFHLGEVGLQREVGAQPLRDGILHVEPRHGIGGVDDTGGHRPVRVQAGGDVGLDVDRAARARGLEADHGRGERHLHHGRVPARGRHA